MRAGVPPRVRGEQNHMRSERGRPALPGCGVWRHPKVVARRVSTIVKHRDLEDCESMDRALNDLNKLARRVLGERPQANTRGDVPIGETGR